MHIKDIDLNLLRLFDAVYRTRNVSRAALSLDLTQPAASQGLTRLRRLVGDPLFVRAAGGVQPTARAQRLAAAVGDALASLEAALAESAHFDPLLSQRTFRLHMTDVGEGSFLPGLMIALRERAPNVRLASEPVAPEQIGPAMDRGRIDCAFGFLPTVKETRRVLLFQDRYVVLLRSGHPHVGRRRGARALLEGLRELEFVSVRTHENTLRILQVLNLEDRLRLTTEHFMALPAVIKASDLAVVMPRNIARSFAAEGGYTILEPEFPLRDFDVSLHWSRRYEADPGNRWLRELIVELFGSA
ncbi:LysR family transcriptional regulator [Candidimonas nitroreducens]|uniref:LysR family transcriptional regulator n=1 Tax=Candidimonas nitroreducens TaxID=683354 RepID=A0A225MS72_9BURK|nr:LysR family transcriptional regulator [Candidimonas nitroreducens]OWT64126.1 LysR family transcriptional regulator [Candidimonas nitroreducens]